MTSDTSGISKTIYQLDNGGYFGVRVYQNVLDASELAALEEEVHCLPEQPMSYMSSILIIQLRHCSKIALTLL